MYFIAEIGSCHMGKLDYAKEAIDLAAEAGADVCKFQLFRGKQYTKSGNIELSEDLWRDIVEYAKDRIPVTASVFDKHTYLMIRGCSGLPFIKFAYSQLHNYDLQSRAYRAGYDIIVSCDHMTYKIPHHKAKKLYCVPEYPVKYKIDFEGCFPKFDGFSDHTYGLEQTFAAVRRGAQIIEKHFKLDHDDIVCPDAEFAITPNKLRVLVKHLREI